MLSKSMLNAYLNGWAVYCNVDSGSCGGTAKYKTAQPGDAYDWEPTACRGTFHIK